MSYPYETLTLDELNKKWTKVVGLCRYYHATDCPNSWNRERAERQANDKVVKEVEEEYKRRRIEPPRVP